MGLPQAASEGRGGSNSTFTGPEARKTQVLDANANANFKKNTNWMLGLNISSYTFLTDPEADIQVGHSLFSATVFAPSGLRSTTPEICSLAI